MGGEFRYVRRSSGSPSTSDEDKSAVGACSATMFSRSTCSTYSRTVRFTFAISGSCSRVIFRSGLASARICVLSTLGQRTTSPTRICDDQPRAFRANIPGRRNVQSRLDVSISRSMISARVREGFGCWNNGCAVLGGTDDSVPTQKPENSGPAAPAKTARARATQRYHSEEGRR